MENYNPFKLTAIKRKGLSKPTKILKDKGLLQGSILNYGCGHNEDGIILSSEGFDIVAYDKFNEEYKNDDVLNKRYDIVICQYVLNVIPDLQKHKEVVELLKKLGDEVYISVRSDIKAIKDHWIYNKEELGYWTGNQSFQRFYNTDMIKDLFGDVTYISNNTSFKLFKIN